MEEWIAFFYIIFGILGIVLFFKVWGMTNDVRRIKNSCTYTDAGSNSEKEWNMKSKFKNLYLLGKVEEAKSYRINYFLMKISELYGDNPNNREKEFANEKSNLEKDLLSIKVEMPATINEIETYSAYLNLFRNEG